jgi:hypothetical protein
MHSRYEKTLEEVTALLERERNDHVMCKAVLAEAEKYSAEVEQAFKELHSRYNVQKVGGVIAKNFAVCWGKYCRTT